MIIHDVEQRSPEWYALRLGVPTSSEFSRAITPKKGQLSTQGVGYAAELALEILRGEPCADFNGNEWTDRGAELEEEALAQYELLHDVDVQRVGFITSDDGLRGASTDGLIGKDGIAEVKCLKDVNHVKAIIAWHESREFDDKYIPQVQGEILIAEREWCDLIFYCPGLPILTIRQKRNDKYCESLDGALTEIIRLRDTALASLGYLKPEQEAA